MAASIGGQIRFTEVCSLVTSRIYLRIFRRLFPAGHETRKAWHASLVTSRKNRLVTRLMACMRCMQSGPVRARALAVAVCALQLQRVTVVMASESLCSAVPQHRRSHLGSNQPSGRDGSEIELLKSRVAELERKFDESRNEVRQVMAELEMLQRTIDQRNPQVELLENEIQLQVRYISRELLSEST